MPFGRRPPTDEVVSIFDALVARKGQTTAPGAAGGTSIIDSGLIGAGANSFANMGVVLYPADPLRVDARTAGIFNNVTGELTLDAAYKGVAAPIPAGVPYVLIPIEIVPAPIVGKVPPTIAGTATMHASVVANWQAAEQDLLTIGAAVAGSATSINFLGVGIQNLIGNISIRLYATINGVERRFFPIPGNRTYTAAADAPCISPINGTMIVPGRLRVTVQSDNAADNGAAVTYEAG